MPDTTTPPKDPRLIEAEIAIAEANARKASAEATAAEISALLPDLPTEVTAGSLTAPEAPAPVATVAAYRALGEVGKEIASELPPAGTVWIVPDGGFQIAIDIHDALATQLARLTKLAKDAVQEIETDPTEPEPREVTEPEIGERVLPVALGVEVLAAAAPLVMSLFATSRTLTSAEVTIGFTAAAAAVATQRPDVCVWGITPPPTLDLEFPIKDLRDARDRLDKALVDTRNTSAPTSAEAEATAEAEAWKAVLTELVKADPTKAIETVKRITDAVARATSARNSSVHIGQVFKSCEQLLQAIDDVLQRVSGSPGAALAAQAALGAALKGASVLVLQPTYTGAESIYEDVKLKRDRALHVGSSIVTWYLLNEDHKLVKSGVQSTHASATTKVGLPEVTWYSVP